MSSRSKNILIALLSIAIIGVNLVTVLYYLSHRPVAEHEFGIPDTIEVRYGEKIVKLTSDDKEFSKILDFTDSRTKFIQYYTPADTQINFDKFSGLYIRFVYDHALSFTFDYQYERKTSEVTSITFPLQDTVSSYAVVGSADSTETLSGLAINAELIKLAEELVK